MSSTKAEIEELAASPDILAIGMAADDVRRRVLGRNVTFARVACCPFDKPLAEAVPVAAREVRLTGARQLWRSRSRPCDPQRRWRESGWFPDSRFSICRRSP
jgi:hypothetical protein